MSDSHTYNLAIVFHKGIAVSIIVCHSEKPIDDEQIEHINQVASETIGFWVICQQQNKKMNAHDLLISIVNGIRQKCGVQAVLVNADSACVIGSAPIN